jgi:uncharacterized membrane protein
MISRRSFLRRLDVPAVERAIVRVETRTSGEIRVSVAGFFLGSGRKLAARAFRRLGMQATRHRNGVLLLIAPARRQFVVLADEGLDGRVPAELWTRIAETLSARFQAGQFTEGVVEAIDATGTALARHFPADAGQNPNELPDAVDLNRR